jgi:hypothetical protein
MNMKGLNFFKKVNKFHGIEIFSEDPLEKINSTSLILINLKLIFELSVHNLI